MCIFVWFWFDSGGQQRSKAEQSFDSFRATTFYSTEVLVVYFFFFWFFGFLFHDSTCSRKGADPSFLLVGFEILFTGYYSDRLLLRRYVRCIAFWSWSTSLQFTIVNFYLTWLTCELHMKFLLFNPFFNILVCPILPSLFRQVVFFSFDKKTKGFLFISSYVIFSHEVHTITFQIRRSCWKKYFSTTYRISCLM